MISLAVKVTEEFSAKISDTSLHEEKKLILHRVEPNGKLFLEARVGGA